MITDELINLAEDLKFSITKEYVFGMINGNIVIISHSLADARNLLVTIDLSHLEESRRFGIYENLSLKFKTNKTQISMSTKSKSIELFNRSTLKMNWEDKKKLILTLIKEIELIPDVIPHELDFIHGRPIYAFQKEILQNELLKSYKSLPVRFLKGLFLGLFIISTLSILGFLSHFFLKLLSNPIFNTFTLVFTTGIFVKEWDKRKETYFSNMILVILLDLILVSSYWIAMLYLSIPKDFNKSAELLLHVLSQSIRNPLNLIFTALGLVLSIMIFNRQFKLRQIKSLSIQEAKEGVRSFKRLSSTAVALLLSGIVMMIISSGIIKGTGMSGYGRIMYFTVFIFHICLLSGTLFFLRKESGKVKYVIALFFPLVASAALAFMLLGLNDRLDRSKPLEKMAIISNELDPSTPHASCNLARDIESNSVLPFNICSREDKFLKTGNKVLYTEKPGYLNMKVYKIKNFLHAETVEDLINQTKRELEDIRSVDIEYLNLKPAEKEKLTTVYLEVWKKECDSRIAISCRLASYVLGLQNLAQDEKATLNKGCELGDYTSCYGFIYVKDNDTEMRTKYESLAVKKCDSGDIGACYQYADIWKVSDDIQRKLSVRRILGKLCDLGDQVKCRQLIWEKNRI